MFRRFWLPTAAAGLLLGALPSFSSGGLVGPTAYVRASDSPFASVDFSAGYFHRETFEDNLLNVPGVTASAGAPFGPSGITDSVDEDDGAVDGSGLGGHSFFSGSGAGGISFTFNSAALGSLPTHAGIVWTDGAGEITFEAFDAGGTSLGVIGPFSDPGQSPDNFITGQTGEDRFFGATNSGGISRIFISNSAGGIEVDHLQFGAAAAGPPPAVPLPPAAIPALATLGALGAIMVLRNRRRCGT